MKKILVLIIVAVTMYFIGYGNGQASVYEKASRGNQLEKLYSGGNK
jgi:hypothetical protein